MLIRLNIHLCLRKPNNSGKTSHARNATMFECIINNLLIIAVFRTWLTKKRSRPAPSFLTTPCFYVYEKSGWQRQGGMARHDSMQPRSQQEKALETRLGNMSPSLLYFLYKQFIPAARMKHFQVRMRNRVC